MIPPGIPDYLSRTRHIQRGRTLVEGRAWSGYGPVERVEFSSDGGRTWDDAELGEQIGRYAWRSWSYEWDAREPGEYELCARATDAAGNRQPVDNNEPWNLGGYRIPNRVVLAPLAGIGNWFVRLQARRHGAGLAFSEMVSSFGLKYGDRRTLSEYLRIHPDEHPVAIQLFGHDPDVMRIAAGIAAERGADLIDINMGCPVRKVCKTGAGASLLDEPDLAVALARAAADGSGLPVTVKLRSGQRPGERTGFELARRLVEEAGVAGISFHPRHAAQQHKGEPDYALAADLVDRLDVPVIVSGGLSSDERALVAFEQTGADAVMLARGSLGNPWRFERLLGLREGEPTRDEVMRELRWVIACAEEHLGTDRAGRYLRKFYPWYAETLGLGRRAAQPLLTAPDTAAARAFLDALAAAPEAVAAA
jgi:nifR3 family TIM-barrel protein